MLILIILLLCFMIILFITLFSIKYERLSEYFGISDQKVTLIILNHLRPHNLELTLPILKSIKEIDQIIVTHGSPSGFKEFEGVENIKDYENNEKYAAGRRFLIDINRINNELIITMDDDHMLSTGFLRRILEEAEKDPNQIYGLHVRGCDENGYDFSPPEDKQNTILTGMSITSKTVIKTFQQHFHEIEPILLKYNGNGEDLAFNWIFRKYYKKNPKYIYGDFIELDGTNGYSSDSKHIENRNSICKELSKL